MQINSGKFNVEFFYIYRGKAEMTDRKTKRQREILAIRKRITKVYYKVIRNDSRQVSYENGMYKKRVDYKVQNVNINMGGRSK